MKEKGPADKSIAITGTAGFLGSHLLKRLEEDPRYSHVVAIDCKKPPFLLKKTRFYRLDLTDVLADNELSEIFSVLATSRNPPSSVSRIALRYHV